MTDSRYNSIRRIRRLAAIGAGAGANIVVVPLCERCANTIANRAVAQTF